MTLSPLNSTKIHWQGDCAAVARFQNLKYSIVKENSQRIIYRGDNSDGVSEVYLKVDKNRGWRNKIKSFFRNRFLSEFNSGKNLQKANIAVSDHLAFGFDGNCSYLLIKALNNYNLVDSLTSDENVKPYEFYIALLTFFLKLVNANFYHPDLHFGNIMWRINAQNNYEFVLLDVYGVKQKKLSYLEKIKTLQIIAVYFPFLSFIQRNHVKSLFSEILKIDGKKLWHDLNIFRAKVCRKYAASRHHKFFTSSSFQEKIKSKIGHWLINRDQIANQELFANAVLHHQNTINSKSENILKIDKKRTISRYFENGKSVIVKEFVKQKLLPTFTTAAYRSWESAKALDQFSINNSKYLAWCHINNGNDYIILEDLGDDNFYLILKKYLQLADKSKTNELLQQLATTVASLHDLGIFHRDLKTDNFMCHEKQLKLIDLDRIRFYKSLPNRNIVKNFQQIIDTLPENISKNTILRLASYYRQCRCISSVKFRNLIKKLD